MVVITPWYPTPARPYDGVFVAESCAALATQGVECEVIHLLNTTAQDLPDPQVGVRRVPFEAPPGTSRAEAARRQQRALASVSDVLESASVVHVHVGIPTGAAVAAVLPDHARLVVTEHATYLATELTYEAGRALYRRVLTRAHRVLTVSDVEARRLRACYPDLRNRVRALGNPVRRLTAPRRPGTARDRWLYVGNLIARKGVLRLVDAFALWAAGHPDARLELAGGGDLEQAIRDRAAEHGIADRVELLGPVAPADLGAVLDRADVLVHLSELETFGMTVAEAAVVGLPVVTARSGGPEEVLARAAEAGLVRFVPRRPTPEQVVAAVRASADVDATEAERARAELERAYGPAAVGRALGSELAGLETPPRGGRLLLVAGSPVGHDRLAGLAAFALRQQVPVTAVVTDAESARALDDRVEVVLVAPHLAIWPHHLLDTVVLDRLPGRLLDGVAAALDGPSRWRGRASRAVSRVRAKHRTLVREARGRVLHPLLYRRLDPQLLARRGAAALHTAADRHGAALVAVLDAESAALGRTLAERLPAARVTSTPLLAEIEDLRDDPAGPDAPVG